MSLLDQLIVLLQRIRPSDEWLCCIVSDDIEINKILEEYRNTIIMLLGIKFITTDEEMQQYAIQIDDVFYRLKIFAQEVA